MAHSERSEELVAALAAGMMLTSERAELDTHRREVCVRCEELLVEWREAAAALASQAPAVAAPQHLRRRILASLGPARVPAANAPMRPRVWAALAAAAALFVVVVGLDDARLRRQREDLRSQSAQLAGRLQSVETELAQRALRARVLESDDVRMLVLGGKAPQPNAQGRVFWSARARRGVLVAGNLAPLPPDRQYELWVFLKGKPVNAGVFDADAQGRALFESHDFSEPQAQNFAVTIEPRGGVPAPTGPMVLIGQSS
ncbi:MAG: anti-sigma factor [Acidobacteriota bacterium]